MSEDQGAQSDKSDGVQDSKVQVETDSPNGDSSNVNPGEPVDHVQALVSGWKDAWQVPALLVGAGLLMIGVAFSISSAPDPDLSPSIRRANQLIENEQFKDAIDVLNTEVYPYLEKPYFPDEDRAEYHLAKARSIYRGQAKLQVSDDRNHLSIIREYLDAERLAGGLAPKDLASLSYTYIARDEVDLAQQRIREIPVTQRHLKDAANTRLIESLLDRPIPETDKAMGLLADMLIDPDLPMDERVWALETQGNVRLEQGFADETITRILRAMPRLERANTAGRSRLHLILAKAYSEIGAPNQARQQVGFAKDQSAAGDLHYSEVLLIEGIILDVQGETLEARDLFSEVVTSYSSSSAYPRALMGLGETEARLDEPELSFEAYTTLVDRYDSFGTESNPSRKQVLDSLLERSGESLSAGDSGDAIIYSTLAERLYKDRETPVEVFSALAIGNQSEAERLLGKPIDQVNTLMGLDPALRTEVQRYLMSSAAYFRLHADRHAVGNLAQYADSLWRSADLFDRAGDQRESIQGFKLYSDSMPSDPRYAEAMFRLAESLRSLGDFQSAAEMYSNLIELKKGSSGADIGPFADQSHVPLAQAYLYDEDPENDKEAESLLKSAIDGSMGSTETSLFRDALLELAGYYDRTDQSERAIERYTEFVTRYPQDPEIGSVRFRVADAHRRLAGDIRVSLEEAMPAVERNRRNEEIRRHFREAISQYEIAISDLSAKPESRLGLFESIALRNSHFYLGDCAFELDEYEQAIQYYDRARDRYGDDPASLVAMVQMVNSYIAMGDYARARTANERAQRFYDSLPPEVWDDPDLPMARKDWEDWLTSSSTLMAMYNN